jgi:aspartate/methionine/tyrosine aminotransferase
MNIVLAICDPGDEVVLFAPYYFNNIMALQLANVTPVIVPCKEDLTPDIAKITFTPKTKMVVLVTPSNPSGAVVPESTIRELQQKCLKANVWYVVMNDVLSLIRLRLVSDEAYEDFIYNENNPHYSADGKNVINIYSFSKAYGMHGWRVG